MTLLLDFFYHLTLSTMQPKKRILKMFFLSSINANCLDEVQVVSKQPSSFSVLWHLCDDTPLI